MNTIHQTGAPVNLNLPSDNPQTYDPIAGASIVKWYKRWDPVRKRWVIVIVSYTNHLGLNDRTRGGRKYETNSLNVRCDVLDEAEADGVETIGIRITYKTLDKTVCYLAPITTIRELGTKEYMYDCWQWSLPLHYWSIDGQPATGAAPEPQPMAEQGALFAFDEPRRMGGGY